MTSNDSALVRLIKLLTTSDRSQLRDLIEACQHTIKDISSTPPIIIEYKSFLINIHDILASESTHTILLAELYRVIRYCLISPDYCDVIVSQDIHWILVVSIEVSNIIDYSSFFLADSLSREKIARCLGMKGCNL